MIPSRRFWLGAVLALFACGRLLAQEWEAGASVGLVNDIHNRFRLDEFKRHDVNVWAGFEIEEKVVLRAMFGSLRAPGTNAGASIEGAPVTPLPDLSDRVNYATLGVCYEFWEGNYTSGLFAGIGGYRVEPEAVDPTLEGFRDRRETVFGVHVGVDAAIRIASRFSLVGRLTVHRFNSTAARLLMTANAGVAYRF